MMRLHADQDRCCGAGNCVRLAPELFEQDDDGLVVLLHPEPAPDLRDAALEAVAICPGGALSVDEERV